MMLGHGTGVVDATTKEGGRNAAGRQTREREGARECERLGLCSSAADASGNSGPSFSAIALSRRRVVRIIAPRRWSLGNGQTLPRIPSGLDAEKLVHSSRALDRLKDARRSRTAARSESSTSPTHRPAIESSSSSTLLASSMMVHIDDDLDAKRTWCRQAIDWIQSHALDCRT